MRGKVREVEPPANTDGLEELVAGELNATPVAGPEDGAPHGRRPESGVIAVRLVEHGRPWSAADLGPNGDVVLDLLSRAVRLTADESRRLDKAAAWRWGLVTPVPSVTTSVPVARALALVRGRRDGRSTAIVALEAAVAQVVHGRSGRRTGSLLPACISNAGLAVLVRDLVDSETFETLFGPWREVMHH